MAEVLSQSEIDALLNALSTGELDAETIKEEEKIKKIREYDFRRPNKFSKDQLNTVTVISDNYCRLITTYLSAQLRTRVTIKVASVEQMTYDEFIRSIPNPTILTVFGLEPLEGKAIYEINPNLVFYIIDRLFGGPGVADVQARPLTEIEQQVVIKSIKKMLLSFKEAWSNIIEIDPQLDVLETNPSFTQIISPTEMVVLVTIEAKLGEVEGLMNICLPCLVLEPISNKLNATFWYGSSAKEQTTEHLRSLKEKIRRSKVPLVAEIGRSKVALHDLLDLQVGDVVTLDRKKEDDVDIVIGSKVKFKGRVGLSGSRLAVQITGTVQEEEWE